MPFYIVLIAAFPTLYLLAQNLAEAEAGDAVAPLVLSLATTLAVFAVLARVLRDARRAALLTTVAVVAFFFFGHFENLVRPLRISETRLLIGWFGVTALATIYLLRTRRDLGLLTAILNVVSVVLVLNLGLTIGSSIVGEVARAAPASPSPSPRPSPSPAGSGLPSPSAGATPTGGDVGGLRDIYYIVVEDWGSARTHQQYVGINDAGLLDWLRDQGFNVLSDTRTNYGRSALSLAASLNMTYLDEVAARYGPDATTYAGISDMVRSPAVGQFLQERGYRFVHIGSQWSFTAASRIADVNPRFRQSSDFQSVLYETTILDPVLTRLGYDSPFGARRRNYEAALWQLDQFEQATALPGPKFVFLHMFLPHDPYIVDEDGTYLSSQSQAGRSLQEQMQDQFTYVTRQVERLVEPLVNQDEATRPIVIVTTDEGTIPPDIGRLNNGDDWFNASTEQLDEHYAAFAAYLLPGESETGLYPTMSTVNTFRLILNLYFDAGLALLPDRYYVHRDVLHPYDLTDITERLDAAAEQGRARYGPFDP